MPNLLKLHDLLVVINLPSMKGFYLNISICALRVRYIHAYLHMDMLSLSNIVISALFDNDYCNRGEPKSFTFMMELLFLR